MYLSMIIAIHLPIKDNLRQEMSMNKSYTSQDASHTSVQRFGLLYLPGQVHTNPLQDDLKRMPSPLGFQLRNESSHVSAREGGKRPQICGGEAG